jgi:hypothetical protein
MIKGLSITPPVLGRISIGKVVEKNGKRLPEKDDQFSVTTQVQTKEGWLTHPLDTQLRAISDNNKIRSIPIGVMFNDPDLNLRAEYSLFDRATGRPVCVGNGESCRRLTTDGVQALPCPSPNLCSWGGNAGCKPYARLNVQIEQQNDDLGSFIFRTTGFNSIRTLAARLSYFKAVSGNLLSCLPLEMRLRAKSTTMSHRTPVYYVDLTIREGLSLGEAIQSAQQIHSERLATGHDQQALDEMARVGFANGQFEETEDELPDVLEEFYPESTASSNEQPIVNTSSITNKLNQKRTQATIH